MLMQNASLIGNCLLWRVNGKSVPFVVRKALERKILEPTFEPDIILTSITCGYIPFTTARVPLHCPFSKFNFL